MSHCNSILAQLMNLVARHEFEKLANEVDGRRKSNALSRWSQFMALSVGHISGRQSLRDIESCMQSHSNHQYHLGCQRMSKSSLGRANQNLSYEFYMKLFQLLYSRCSAHTPRHKFRFKSKLFSLDGSLLDASMKVFPWARFNRLKSAFKLHVALDHDGLIPAFASITEGVGSETNEAKSFNFPRGSVVVFDRGYNNYHWHESLTNQGVYWVGRIRSRTNYRVVERKLVNAKDGITSDQIIQYTSTAKGRNKLPAIRRVGYRDPETGKHFVFITNQLEWSAKTIAAIYKQRWQVELFFKWIKQNLKIKSFLGNTKNAVLTQIFMALCVYLITAFLKFISRTSMSLQKVFRLLQTNLFNRQFIHNLLKPPKIDHKPALQQMALALARR